MKKLLALFAFLLYIHSVCAQAHFRSILGGTSTGTAVASACIEGRSTTTGWLAPRLTTTQRNAISSPANSLLMYNTTDSAFHFYRSNTWQALGWGLSGNANTATGNFCGTKDYKNFILGAYNYRPLMIDTIGRVSVTNYTWIDSFLEANTLKKAFTLGFMNTSTNTFSSLAVDSNEYYHQIYDITNGWGLTNFSAIAHPSGIMSTESALATDSLSYQYGVYSYPSTASATFEGKSTEITVVNKNRSEDIARVNIQFDPQKDIPEIRFLTEDTARNASIIVLKNNEVRPADGVWNLGSISYKWKNLVSVTMRLTSVPTYADDATATGAGLTSGQVYKTTTGGSTFLKIVP